MIFASEYIIQANNMKIVILAGGGGTRLFPLSRACYPKQFLRIANNESLLVQTIMRFKGIVKTNDLIIVTNENYIFHVKEDLETIGITDANIITEPSGRNTAPAIALAISFCKDNLKCKNDEVIFVCPSDHIVRPITMFNTVLKNNIDIVKAGYILTFGFKPTGPETGYGYIEIGDKKADNVFTVNSFKEKPNIFIAQQYLERGNYFWNSGMFMFTIKTMEEEIKSHIPQISEIARGGYDRALENFKNMPDISIDYAIAERSSKMVVAVMTGIYWSDVGSFDAIANILATEDGNAFYGDVITEDCSDTLILGANRLIAGIGLHGLMIIDTPDALLVTKKGDSQKVKNVVEKLKSTNRKEITKNITMFRPWGSYTILSEGEGYKVKKIIIKPGAKLSLQMHYHRSEHWTVIKGTGKLTVGEKEIIFKENESTYIPIGVKHRLENPGQISLAIIEVQNGKYLGEDDIVRFDDVYGR